MADQDDFTFEEQENDSEEWYEEEEPEEEKKSGSRTRLLLLLLLLIVIAGGGYFFMMMPAEDSGPAAPPKQVVKLEKKKVAIPAKSNPVAPKQVPADEAKKPAEAKPAPVAEPVPDKASPAPVAMPAEKAPAASSAPVKEEAVASAPREMETPKQVFQKPEQPAPARVAASPAGPYTLTAGTYLLQSSVNGVSNKIRAFGYEPVITPVKRTVTMTRLKVGTYSQAEAAVKKAELKSLAPGVFGIRAGDQETVYAGSYLVVDKARRFADSLFNKGIQLEEESVQVEKTLQRVTFGSFAGADEAKALARQAAAKGIEALVHKVR